MLLGSFRVWMPTRRVASARRGAQGVAFQAPRVADPPAHSKRRRAAYSPAKALLSTSTPLSSAIAATRLTGALSSCACRAISTKVSGLTLSFKTRRWDPRRWAKSALAFRLARTTSPRCLASATAGSLWIKRWRCWRENPLPRAAAETVVPPESALRARSRFDSLVAALDTPSILASPHRQEFEPQRATGVLAQTMPRVARWISERR